VVGVLLALGGLLLTGGFVVVGLFDEHAASPANAATNIPAYDFTKAKLASLSNASNPSPSVPAALRQH
jgi:hypothetical protein